MHTPLRLLATLAVLALSACAGDGSTDAKSNDDAGNTGDTDATGDTDDTVDTTDTDDTTPPDDPDADGDGFDEAAGDCDDADDSAYPGAPDLAGDGIDQNCDDTNGVDDDGDGVASLESGGLDCDDGSAGTNPGIPDFFGDTVDQDCDGTDGVDDDADGSASEASGGADCNDASPVISPLATDLFGDSVDQNCDGVDGTDADGDGYASVISGGDDCDDADPAVSPLANDLVGDGDDVNRDGLDGVDADGDGFASMASGGADCDDTQVILTPVDGDLDGQSTCDGDCDDADSARFRGNVEVCNAIDDDCSLVVDVDAAALDVCLRAEDFTLGSGMLDLLLLVDDSCSMAAKQARLADGADELLTSLDAADIHVGVITTDMMDPSKTGKLQPGPDGALWLDDATPLADQIRWLDATSQPGTFGSGTEEGLDAVQSALNSALNIAGFNAGFLRDGADLGIILLSDEEDFSTKADPLSVDAFLQATWLPPAVVSVHAIAGGPASCGVDWVSYGAAYLDLASIYGGERVSICDADWQDDLTLMGDAMLPLAGGDTVVLSEVPDPATIAIVATEPDGTIVTPLAPADWVFDLLGNAILFTGYLPPPGTALAVTYRVDP